MRRQKDELSPLKGKRDDASDLILKEQFGPFTSLYVLQSVFCVFVNT